MDTPEAPVAEADSGPLRGRPPALRLAIPYLASLASIAVPAAVTAALLKYPHLRAFVSFAFVLDIAAVSWLVGFWAGALVTIAAPWVIALVVSGGKSFVPQKFDFAVLCVMILIAALASRVAAARQRAEAVLRSANRELDARVKARTAELEHAREALQITLASIGDAVIATDTAGRITLLNGVAETLTGWPAQEALGRHLDEIFVGVNAGTRAPVESVVAKVLRVGTATGLADRTLLIARDGREIAIDDSGAPIRTRTGEVAGVVLTFRDISERYRAEAERQKLLEADERLVGILTNINDGFLTVDRQWRLSFLNRKASELVRRPSEELLGSTLWQALPSLEQTAAGDELRRAMQQNVPVRCSVQYEPLRAWFDLGAYPSGDGLALLIRDITENQRLEAQLLQAQKMEAVGRLAGGIAHDFNNLLTVINGYAEFALQDIPKDLQLSETINEILLAGRRAAELTNGLLTFSRKQVRQPIVLKLNDIVSGTEKMVRRLVGEDIEITTTLEKDLWDVEADRSQLEQIVVNLAANARDAMPRGGHLTIETGNAELDDTTGSRFGIPAGRYAMLSVTDDGLGMDATTQAHIFEPFFTTKGPGKGTGLGLATVYGIVHQSGGGIAVYSEPGRGASFKIYLPGRHPAGASPQTEAHDAILPAPRGKRRNILLVEDEENVRKLTRTLLERHGFRVLEASSGLAALAVCKAEGGALDLVLSDLVMPHMSGDQLALELHREYPELKVLFMSGFAEHAVVSQALLTPGVIFLSKPFTAAALLSKVNQALQPSSQASGTGA